MAFTPTAHSKRYTVSSWSYIQTGAMKCFTVVDSTVIQKDLKGPHAERLEREQEEQATIATFHINHRVGIDQARLSAHEYADYLNRKQDAAELAAALVQL